MLHAVRQHTMSLVLVPFYLIESLFDGASLSYEVISLNAPARSEVGTSGLWSAIHPECLWKRLQMILLLKDPTGEQLVTHDYIYINIYMHTDITHFLSP